MNSKSDIVKVLSPLAEAMKAKKELGEPYLLCLGEGATLSSGCRDMRWAVRNTIAEEYPWALDEVLEKLGRPERCGEDKDKFEKLLRTVTEDQWYPPLRRKFFELLDHRRGAERKQRLDVFLSEDFPSYGYAFLVLLAREGFRSTSLLRYALRRYFTFIRQWPIRGPLSAAGQSGGPER